MASGNQAERAEAQLHLIAHYQDAVQWLEAIAEEVQRVPDTSSLLQHCDTVLQSLEQLLVMEDNSLRLVAIEQVIQSLSHHVEVPTERDIKPTTTAPNGVSSEERNRTCTNQQATRCHKVVSNMLKSSSRLQFSDVAGLSQAKQSLREAVILPIHYPHLFTGPRQPWTRILLYGPPGTGKTRLAQAVSGESGSTFYSVSSSDLISSLVGESEKIIRELFQQARQSGHQSIVFIDEVDSVCRSRSSKEEEFTRRVKTELLHQMEGVACEGHDRMFLLCATNCPWELDPAFLRRFQKRIHIPLPDREGRLALIQLHTQETYYNCLSSDEWEELVIKTEGYSGSDISTIIADGLLEPVRELETATHWKPASSDGSCYTPCSEHDDMTINCDISQFHSSQVCPRSIKLSDFMKVLNHTHPTVTKEMIAKYNKFATGK